MAVKPTANLIALCGRSWTLPILAHLVAYDGARFVELLQATGASRGALSETLKALGRIGLVAPNPGYGHPLRPEYVVTPRGLAVATASTVLLKRAAELRMRRAVLLRKWALPVLYVLGSERLRFSEVRVQLGNPTPRSVSLSLKQLSAERWIDRHVIDAMPPSANYAVARRLRPILRPLRILAASYP